MWPRRLRASAKIAAPRKVNPSISRRPAVGVHAGNDGDGGAERGDLREREVHKDDAAFDTWTPR